MPLGGSQGGGGEHHAAEEWEGALFTPQLSLEKYLQIKFLKVILVLLRILAAQDSG